MLVLIISNMKNTSFIVLALLLVLGGCKKEESVMEKDDRVIRNYLKDNDIIDAFKDPSGVYIQHIKEGTGDSPSILAEVTVKYALYTLPTDEFVPQTEDPVTFKLSNLIEGWKIGIPYMKKGGEAYLYIPSTYAYGGTSSPLANKVLKFKISLLDF